MPSSFMTSKTRRGVSRRLGRSHFCQQSTRTLTLMSILGPSRCLKSFTAVSQRSTPEKFTEWLKNINATMMPQISVLVGAPIQTEVGLSLNNAYALAREHAPDLLLGGIAIAERHARSLNEHERIVAKTAMGCRFFVTQPVYDVTSTKSLLSDYALAVREKNVVPLRLFSPSRRVAP